MPICGARTKTCRNCGHRFTKAEYDLWECPECGEDRHCQQHVLHEGQRCRMHGGKSLVGPAAGSYKHGRYSKLLPTGLSERYETAFEDQDMLALRDEIALLDARLGDLVGSLAVGTTTTLWEELSTAFSDLQFSLTNKDPEGANQAMQALKDSINQGKNESLTWVEIYALLDARRKLVESERKRLLQMQQVITVEQAMVLLARVQQSIVENIKDKHVLSAIATDLSAIVNY